MKPICLLFLISICSFSCKKTVFNYTTSGKIIDANTGLGIPNSKVRLDRFKGELLGSTSMAFVDSTITDADGEYKFKLKHERGWQYEVRAQADNYFFDNSNDYVSSSRHADIKLLPQATLEFDVRNTKGGAGVYFTTLNTRIIQKTDETGQGTFQKFPCIVEGNKLISIYYYIYEKTGNKTKYDTTIYCPSFQTTTFRIDY